MSQKSGKGAGAGTKVPVKGKKGGKKVEDEREETLQAVILADSFETRFNPFTLETPRCLLPLANTPLIEYTLEFLAMSSVADIFVYCGAHTEEVERYIQATKWYPPNSIASPFNTLEIVKTTARSVGDALRDLDARDLITGDFLLVHGDLVSNLPIDQALAAHRARRTADKNAIMTIVLRDEGLEPQREHSKGIAPVFVLDPTNNRCLHYEEMHPLQANKYVNIDPDLVKENTEMEIRTDLIDCGIDICTPDVLALWAESFDYEVPRRHFLHGVLKDYELNGKTIHTEIIENRYAARASNLQSYDAVSKDVLERWTFPFVPDSNLFAGQSYRYGKGGICKENGVVLSRTCNIGKRTILGKDTRVEEGSKVSSSIIGRRCTIGKNVTIKESYIWDDVTIGDGSTVERAIIANKAIVGQKSHIRPGALVSYGVHIDGNQEVKGSSRITRAKRRKNSIEEEVPPDPKIVGETGSGYAFEDKDEVSDDEATAFHSTLIYSTAHLNISTESISTISSEISAPSPATSRSRHSSFISEDSESCTNEAFHHDAVEGLLGTLRENGDFDSAKLEFMGLRLSNNATDQQIRRAIAVAFTKRISQLVENDKLDATKAAAQAFGVSGADRFIKNVAIGDDGSEADQVDFIYRLQKDLVHRSNGAMILAAVSQRLYQMEILEEKAFLKWWGESEGLGEGEDDGMKAVRGKTKVFIDWLEEAEEEDSDEDEDDDESD
ncbi:nucleotide-diphospho-sugar transferase [Amylocarpus encephaloides]|uniref:Mannose-1-phosphate guanyltransferase n=1 Tax=Amylocarpus encephaloides TaxID=45428 RepID=A0A9P7YQ21_9HELO|nr:nucleotide-diphospho-sugar transferase [Amylocarpus encephaloides]